MDKFINISKFMQALFDDEKIAEQASEIGQAILAARSLQMTDISVAMAGNSDADLHRPLTAKEDFACILAWQETRILSKNLTLQFHKTVYQIQTKRPSYALRNAHVTVCVSDQDQITILYNVKALPYTIYNQQAQQAEVVAAKQLDRTLQQKRLPTKPAPDHPWRQGFATPLSKRGNATFTRKADISILENR
jgi:hypothetical protein